MPLELVELDADARLAELPRLLGERVFGQPAVVGAVARALGRAYRGLRDPRRPIASFLFAGPTGVGKTALARAIAEILFDSPAALLRIDMSEYMEKHAVARLLGAPPGYVGHDDEGLLVSALRRRPASVVLFDEIEKAHPDVLDILLQILDDGTVRGARGAEASFREAVVVATSNLLSDESGKRAPVGFGAAVDEPPDDEAALRAELARRLRPELVGRLGQVIRFGALDGEACRRIAARHLQLMVQRLLAQRTLDAPPPAALRERILARAVASRFGGRDTERMVDDELDAWLAGAAAASPPAPGAIVIDALRGRTRWTGALLLLRGLPAADVPALLRAVEACAEATDLVLLRHAGDGAVALFGGAATALACARAVAAPRRVLHWGSVNRSEGSPPSGPDLDELLRVGRAGDPDPAIAVTEAAADHLSPADLAGTRRI
jgi:ATP-dependent Clp protease ATP-binding subunit ClpC